MKIILATLALFFAITGSAFASVRSVHSDGDSGYGLPACTPLLVGLRAVNAYGENVYCTGDLYGNHWTRF